MGYWTEVKDVLLKGVNLAGEGLKEGAESMIDRTRDGLQTVQLKKDLFFKQREYQEAIAEVGEVVVDLYKEKKDFQSDAKFLEKIKTVEEKEQQCRELEQKINASEKEDAQKNEEKPKEKSKE